MDVCVAGLGKLQEVSNKIRAKGKPQASNKKQSTISKISGSKKNKTKFDELEQSGEVDIENGLEIVSSPPLLLSMTKKVPSLKTQKDISKSKPHQKPIAKKENDTSKKFKEEKGGVSKLTDFFKERIHVDTDPTKREDQFNFNPSYLRELAKNFPDTYWKEFTMEEGGDIEGFNNERDIQLIESHISDRGAILGLHVSDDGELLATFSTLGIIKIWDTTTFNLLQELHDKNEDNFDEFYVGQFSHDSSLIVAGGKLKDKRRWSHEDDDNHILPCPIKIFDVVNGSVLAKLEGHEEEILCIKAVKFKHENYYLTTSQDGYIIRWHMDSDWKTLISKQRMDDGITCMAFTVSMVPNTGNKYFLGACDEHIRLFDFEACTLLQTFADIYSSYCDCGKFIRYIDQDQEEDNNDNEDGGGGGAYFISRGVELLDSEGNSIASRPNTCTLHKLIFPKRKNGKFELREIRRYKHDE